MSERNRAAVTVVPLGAPGALLAGLLLVLIVLPTVALLASSSPADIAVGVTHPLFFPALWLSLQTTLTSLVVIVVLATPLAWWLATSHSRWVRFVEVMVELPIVIPPAVVGVALLATYGRAGLLGPLLSHFELTVPFSRAAVVLAQVVVAAPFFTLSAAGAFRRVDPDLLLVARTLGASGRRAFFRVALPLAMPGLLVGACLSWARALGEFGATLLFAGNLTGSTQTMPLAIFTALQSEVRLAVVFSLVLAALGALLLFGLRAAPSLRDVRGGRERKGAMA